MNPYKKFKQECEEEILFQGEDSILNNVTTEYC
jgi:hypothetical protein